MPQFDHISREFRNVQVVIRLILRIIVLCLFATLGNVGFARSLVALLLLSAIMSAAVGVLRRESIFDPALTYWDEAAAYGAVCCVASILRESWGPLNNADATAYPPEAYASLIRSIVACARIHIQPSGYYGRVRCAVGDIPETGSPIGSTEADRLPGDHR